MSTGAFFILLVHQWRAFCVVEAAGIEAFAA
jgi:hypothetical protein